MFAPSRREHVPFWRVVAEALVAAVLLTVAMICLELFVPKYTSTAARIDSLEPHTFGDLGFGIGVPDRWTVDVSDRAAAAYSGDEVAGVSTRGFRAVPTEVAWSAVPRESERIDASRFISHDLVATAKGRLGGRSTYRRILFVDGRRIEQVWVDLGGGRSLRIELWSRAADDTAASTNARILRTLEVS